MGDPMMMAATFGLQMIQQSQQQKAQQSMAKAQANAEATRLRQQQDIRNRQRREQLTRALATQKARFGASGLGGGGGSANAVLQGLRNETARRIGDEEEGLGISLQALDNQAANVRRRNLLERRNFVQGNLFNAGLQGLQQLRNKSLLEQ